MKLTEKQAFKIIRDFFEYFGNIGEISQEEKADYVMLKLINLELDD